MANDSADTRAPIVAHPGEAIAARGGSFQLHEWAHGAGTGPGIPLHVHHRGDEAWHVLEGMLIFRFADRSIDIPAGASVFVPAGVAHTFAAAPGGARYLIAMSPEISELIAALHEDGPLSADDTAAIYRRFNSDILE